MNSAEYKEPLISVVIVSYNVRALLEKCLNSLFKFSKHKMEVWVVDNDSGDGSVDMIKATFPDVHVVENKFNAGFPAANNQALSESKGDYIFLLNPDAEIISDCISGFIDFSESNKNTCIIVPQLLNSDGSVQFSIQPFISTWEIILEVFYLHISLKRMKSYYRQPILKPILVEAVSGAAVFFHRSVLEKTGLLDEELFWTEDMEFCYRASKLQIPRYYLPYLRIIHHEGQSGKKNRDIMVSNQVLSKIRYFYKTQGVFAGLVAAAARFIHMITRIFLFFILSPFSSGFRTRLHAYVFTLKRFVKGDY